LAPLALTGATASCGRQGEDGSGQPELRSSGGPPPAARVPAAESAAAVHVAPGGRAHVGRPHDTTAAQHAAWDLAAVEARLRDAALAPERAAGSVAQPFMAVPGVPLRVLGGRGELQVYLYGDALARARDTERLDPQRVAPPTMMISWRMPVSLVVDNNLAVIVLTREDAVRDRVRAALAGGHGWRASGR
jgi:hypothetical protein